MRRRGLTLLEVLVALAILAVGLAGVLPAFVGFLRVNSRSEVITAASNVAQTFFERYRLQDPEAMPTSGTQSTQVDYQGRTFEVATSYCVQASYCGTGSRDIQVTVSYRGSPAFTAETVYTKVNDTAN